MIHEAIKLVTEERNDFVPHPLNYIQPDQAPVPMVLVYFLQVNRH